ncbi:hypothetical protein MTR67_023622 [Solanum verrucosum]|uniref:RNase H type-1 domain-containing protein n=1 Tax=Solanum verrucosum TaxID=315347 RepID=A0AAF0QTU9_SOLVR|nr:hypothetical protein MTR67_023622 [Solanum verrucosum]
MGVRELKWLHEKVRLHLVKKNQDVAKRANKGRKRIVFEPDDWVWVLFRNEQIPTHRKTKLMPRNDGPFPVIERLNDNAYKVALPPKYQVHNTFNAMVPARLKFQNVARAEANIEKLADQVGAPPSPLGEPDLARPLSLLGVGPLAHYTSNNNRFNNDSVSEFIEDGHWNIPKVLRVAPLSQRLPLLSLSRYRHYRATFNSGDFAKTVWRCAAKYGGKQSNIARVKNLVILDTFKLLHTVFPYISWPLRWNKLCNVIEKCTQDTKVTAVQWTKPPHRWVKLNTDGSALSNPGSIGAGGVIRNHLGEIILAFSAPLGTGTNNQAEVEAAIFGIT